jgi:hypothetical protein
MKDHPAIRVCNPEKYTVFNRFSRATTIVTDTARLRNLPATLVV